MGLSGKHPADLCQNKGGQNCHNCGNGCQTGAATPVGENAEVVAAITKKVMEQLGL